MSGVHLRDFGNGRRNERYAPLGDLDPVNPPSTGTALGVPRTKPVISWKDIVTLLISLVCLTAAVCTVFPQSVAMYLGQVDQLIVLGFLLSIMSLCTQRQVTLSTLVLEACTGKVTLQDFDALLRNDLFAAQTGIRARSVLLVLILLPLGLGIAYKNFTGGTSTASVELSGMFGPVGPPGYQRLGMGNTLLANMYLPFWQKPEFPKSYGFNLFVESNSTSAALDALFPDVLEPLQSSLSTSQSVSFTTTVNATVAEYLPLTADQQYNRTWWIDLFRDYPDSSYNSQYMYHGIWVGLLIGSNPAAPDVLPTNLTQAFVSVFNVTKNETFNSTAQRIVLSRRECEGTWNVTSSAVKLVSARILQTYGEALLKVDQKIIQDASMPLSQLFYQQVAEYDWLSYPRATSTNTAPPLVLAMYWARIVSQIGRADDLTNYNSQWAYMNHYHKRSSEVVAHKTSSTLQRSPLLLIVLAIHPIITLIATCIVWYLHDIPVSDTLNVVSLMAAVDQASLAVLEGAGLSGKLARKVFVRFDAGRDRRIRMSLNEKGTSIRLARNVEYR